MTRKVTIALDVMGGDHGPAAVIPAALATLERDDSVGFILVGLPEVLEGARHDSKDSYGSRLRYVAATEVVAMDELPSEALRRKKDSSLRVVIEQVKCGEADACVSSGNTGALMATPREITLGFQLRDFERERRIAEIASDQRHVFRGRGIGFHMRGVIFPKKRDGCGAVVQFLH